MGGVRYGQRKQQELREATLQTKHDEQRTSVVMQVDP
jgi:hypothetical protein